MAWPSVPDVVMYAKVRAAGLRFGPRVVVIATSRRKAAANLLVKKFDHEVGLYRAKEFDPELGFYRADEFDRELGLYRADEFDRELGLDRADEFDREFGLYR